MAQYGFVGGLFRLGFSFGIGLLMSRNFRPLKIRGAFWVCTCLMAVLMCMPYVSFDGDPSMLNGIYDLVCTLILFPCIVWLGASGHTSDIYSRKICSFLGTISYPIYIIHYPAMYLFYAWVWNNGLTFSQAWPVTLIIFICLFPAAYLSERFYDVPVRRWLSRKVQG